MTVWIMSSSAILKESVEKQSWPSSSLQSAYVSSKSFDLILIILMGEITFYNYRTALLHELKPKQLLTHLRFGLQSFCDIPKLDASK